MSSGPTLVGETCIETIKKKYVHLDFSKDLYCTYGGTCKIDNLVFSRDIACYFCRYRSLVDVPELIDLKIEGGKEK